MASKIDSEMFQDSTPRDLELDGDTFVELLGIAGKKIKEQFDTLSEQPSWNTENADQVLGELDLDISDSRTDFSSLVQELFQKAIPCSFNTASPGYLAYIPGGGLPQSALAELISTATNRYMGVWEAAPCLAAIEQAVIKWLCQLFGLGPESGGILTSGGSLANWTAMVTARTQMLGEDFLDGVLYCSNQSHHCVEKAARLCGLRPRNIRPIAVDSECRLRINELEKAIDQDRKQGLRPFFVAGNAGTTNSGAVDPLVELGALCKREQLWFHVDAAYGGFFMLTERGRERLKGIEQADSIVVDPHKGLFLPYGTGALIVNRVQDLKKTHRLEADYLPDYQDDQTKTDFHEISPELSRDFRGLRMWLPLKMYGERVFGDYLDEKLKLTEWIYRRLDDLEFENLNVRIVTSPQLSIVTFRVESKNWSESQTEHWNREFLKRVNARKNVYLTSTLLGSEFVIRICVLSFRTHLPEMETCFNDIVEELKQLESELLTLSDPMSGGSSGRQ